jgi:sn-glycerol 3-phosphate transport system substrate-binding protein
MLGIRMLRAKMSAAFAVGFSAFEAPAQQRQGFDYWYGLAGQLGEVMAEHCKRFNESETQYKALCTGHGGYDRAEESTIVADHARRHAIMVQIHDAGTVDFMLSGASYSARRYLRACA